MAGDVSLMGTFSAPQGNLGGLLAAAAACNQQVKGCCQPTNNQQPQITNNLEQPSTDKNIQNKWPVTGMANQPTNRQKKWKTDPAGFQTWEERAAPRVKNSPRGRSLENTIQFIYFPKRIIFSFWLLFHWRLYSQKKNKSWFPLHFALDAMQLCVWAFSSPCGIEPLTLVPMTTILERRVNFTPTFNSPL